MEVDVAGVGHVDVIGDVGSGDDDARTGGLLDGDGRVGTHRCGDESHHLRQVFEFGD